MKKLFFTLLSILLPYCLSAQGTKVNEVLDEVVSILTEGGGVQMDFEGTESGTLLMKGEKFYLHSGHIQSWYDGKTQWSYVADTEEVNISEPAPEELQGINPYFILMNYQENFNSSYNGMKSHKGKQVHEITLTSKTNNDERFVLGISKMNYPVYIKVEKGGKTVSEIQVKKVQKQQQMNDQVFRFNKSLYPNADIIDLR